MKQYGHKKHLPPVAGVGDVTTCQVYHMLIQKGT